MSIMKQIIFASVLICALLSTATAQDSTAAIVQKTSLTITAAAAGERVRITAPSSVVQMHVEVYAPNGEKLFDQEIRGGNVFDWHLQDGQAQRLVPGAYICVVTAKSISGKLTQKIGTVRVEENSVSVQPAESLSAPQAQTIGPVEENSSWTILGEKENQTTTVIAHDGADGQLIRGRGALTFRIGDFFSGSDQEQMRLTEDGDLGIGTAKPTAKLDVAGTIRARGGFAFSDGSTLNVNNKGALTVTSATGSVVPSAAGSGTLNRVAKWNETGGAGTLTDGAVFESGGLVFIGQNSAGQLGPLFPTSSQFHTLEIGVPPGGKSPLTLAGGSGVMEFWKDLGNPAPAAAVSFGLAVPGTSATSDMLFSNFSPIAGWKERMRVTAAGNVGIGTPTPLAPLDVAGNINTSTQFNIGGTRVLSVSGTNNLFAGAEAGGANTTGPGNSFLGSGAGFNNTTGGANVFLGYQAGAVNGTGTFNTFVGYTAGGSNTTGSNNTMLGFNADVGPGNLTNATAIGAGAQVTQSNSLVLGDTDVKVGIGTPAPLATLDVRGNVFVGLTGDPSSPGGNSLFLANDGGDSHNSFRIDAANDNLYIIAHSNNGTSTNAGIIFRVPVFAGGQAEADVVTIEPGGNVKLANLGTASSTQAPLCRNSSLEIAFCNSSSLRYKSNVATFVGGLDIINRLRPISFRWKQDGTKDIGFGAEEVEKVAPLFTFKNDKGQIEGVRYDRLSVLFVNAIKEQQTKIQQQQTRNAEQQRQINQQQAEIATLNARLRAIETTMRKKPVRRR